MRAFVVVTLLLAAPSVAGAACPLPVRNDPGIDPSVEALERQQDAQNASLAPAPDGFDCQLWDTLSTEQKIDLHVAAWRLYTLQTQASR